MKVIEAPPLQFRCRKCGALNEGSENEFRPQHTMPPSWLARCGFCHLDNQVFPMALISKAVASMFL